MAGEGPPPPRRLNSVPGRRPTDETVNLFDPDHPPRSEDEWRRILGRLIESLSDFIGVRLAPTSTWSEGEPGHARGGGADVRGWVNAALGIDVCGMICVGINRGERIAVGCDLMLFASGRRFTGPGDADSLLLSFMPTGWKIQGWIGDSYGEWGAYGR